MDKDRWFMVLMILLGMVPPALLIFALFFR
jgi:hypothetical protein